MDNSNTEQQAPAKETDEQKTTREVIENKRKRLIDEHEEWLRNFWYNK